MFSSLRLYKLVIALAVVSGCAAPLNPSSDFREVALREFSLRPKSEAKDLFKLTYQAAMGSEHLGVDLNMAREWLEKESTSLGPGLPDEPLYEEISPGGSIVRVNLRPYLKGGRSLDSLARAFVETAAVVPRDTALLVSYWREVEQLSAEKKIPIPEEDLALMLSAARANSFPAAGHSQVYRSAYNPAYRVVHRSQLPMLGIAR